LVLKINESISESTNQSIKRWLT